jgi:hypothetical protein
MQETPQQPSQGSEPRTLNLEGVIEQLTAMYTPPIEFAMMEEINIFLKRPETATSQWVPTLQSLAIDPNKSIQHRIFVDCYMVYLASPGYLQNGKFEPFPFWLSQPAGFAHPPRSSILKKRPRKMMELFLSSANGPRVFDVRNRDLALNLSAMAPF